MGENEGKRGRVVFASIVVLLGLGMLASQLLMKEPKLEGKERSHL